MATTYLSKTLGTPTNTKIWTFSAWCKRSIPDATGTLISSGSSTTDTISMASNGKLNYYVAAGNSGQLTTNRLFQDVSSWYHIVVAVDTTQSTASNRIKIYVNGVQETSFSTETYPSQNFDTKMNSAILHTIGGYSEGSSGEFWNGLMTQVILVDGLQLTPSTFGSINSTSGIWVANTSPTVTYGNNGFNLDFANSSDMGNDVSGNANDFTVIAGTLTQAKDCPDNNFATLSPLIVIANTRYSNGNLTAGRNSGEPWSNALSTLAMRGSGKFYWENKLDSSTNGSGHNPLQVGIQSFNDGSDATFADLQIDGGLANSAYGASNYIWRNQGGTVSKFHNTSSTTWGVAVTPGNIIMTAFDVANGKIWWGRNGTWFSSGSYVGNPASGTYEAFSGISTTTDWFPVSAVEESYTSFNFGNGYFGTTAVASPGTNASAIGIFEYDVPTGFTALSTKGLNL